MITDHNEQTGKKLITKGHHKIHVHIESIVYIQCHGGLATIFLNDGKKVYEIKTLKAFEESLCSMGFMRICRNTLINGKYVTKVDTNKGNRIVYLGDIELGISKRQLKDLRGRLF